MVLIKQMSLIFIAFIVIVSRSYAGSVSGGGGDTTNPNPADPEWVVSAVRFDAGPAILAWLNEREKEFSRLSEDQQIKSPYSKFFRAEKNVFALIREINVELSMSSPCLDAFGNPKDGSIYGSKPNTICLSPFLMAPKLNDLNVEYETVALVIHELSHLLGADEAEAEYIQRHAIYNLHNVDFSDLIVKAKLLAEGTLGGEIQEVSNLVDLNRIQDLRAADIARWNDGLLRLRDTSLTYSFVRASFLRNHSEELFTPQFVKTSAISDYVCSQDPHEDPQMRQYCLEGLEKGYGGADVLSAFQYRKNQDGMGCDLPGYDEVLLKRIDSLKVLASEITDVKNYLMQIKNEVRELAFFQMNVLRRK